MDWNRDSRNRITHGKLIFDQIQWQFSATLFNKKCQNNGYAYAKKTLNPYFVLYMKINSKYFINLNVKPITIKILEDNRGENFDTLVKAKIFLVATPKTQHIKEN